MFAQSSTLVPLNPSVSPPADSCQLMSRILAAAEQNQEYVKALGEGFGKYQLTQYKIKELTPEKVRLSYSKLSDKFYRCDKTRHTSDSWFDNQLKIFIWTSVCLSHNLKISIDSFGPAEVSQLSQIFGAKDSTLVEFQLRMLCHAHGKSKPWAQEEDFILRSLIKPKSENKKWNYAAKQLYIFSNKAFFRTPKQCRQRWLNHLDPDVVREDWSIQEDALLLEEVMKSGKKWASIVRSMGGNRTEHAVKNRYNSLLRPLLRNKQEGEQRKIANRLLYRMRKNVNRKKSSPKANPCVKIQGAADSDEANQIEGSEFLMAEQEENIFQLELDSRMDLDMNYSSLISVPAGVGESVKPTTFDFEDFFV